MSTKPGPARAGLSLKGRRDREDGERRAGRASLFYGGGRGEFHVVDVSDPALLHDIASADTGAHGLGLAEIMGFASHGDHIYVGAGTGGLQVYSFPGASH